MAQRKRKRDDAMEEEDGADESGTSSKYVQREYGQSRHALSDEHEGFEDTHPDDVTLMAEESIEAEEEQPEVTLDDFMANPEGHGMLVGGAMEEESEEEQRAQGTRVFRPGVDRLQEGEVLDYDASSYIMLHALNVEWPCLSFDVIQDTLGFSRASYPHTMYWVAGTQADRQDNNRLYIIKGSQLHKTIEDEDDPVEGFDPDGKDEAGEEGDDDPVVDFRYIHHHGTVNRVRVLLPSYRHAILLPMRVRRKEKGKRQS
eukprot:TRINITY_DN10507_c0_g1_i2.p1 TRINITY_DN10507_c0_g1~~TRINITY_DN10507_c0_g1_i2.p1  ORF type:complete len:268 (+),score=71.33 TRINITY_DN10507_c0_g1_i2:33-806(+)